jgi:hypothetical protein
MGPCSVGMPPITVTTKTQRPLRLWGRIRGTRPPLNGFEITNVTQHTQGGVLLGAEFITMAHETFVYCVSMSFNDALENEFDTKGLRRNL